MGVMSRMMKSVFLSASSCRRRMSSSSSSSLFLVSRFSPETDNRYFSLISSENGARVRDFQSPYFGGSEYTEVRLSRCEGLVLLYHAPNEERLWNPWTNDFKLIPPSYVPRPPNKTRYVIDVGAFGYDPKSGDYKIIRLVRNFYGDNVGHGGVLQVELYSLRDNSWKEMEISDDNPYFNYFRWNYSYYGVESLWKEIFEDPTHPYFTSDGLTCLGFSHYANGCCYWRTYKDNILSFDFAIERFTSFSLPNTGMFEFFPSYNCHRIDGISYSLHLLEFDGLLGAIVYTEKYSSHSQEMSVFDGELWVWNNESWTRKFEIHVVGPGISKILGFISDNHLLFRSAEYQLLMYDVGTQQLKKFDIYGGCDMEVFPYFDSKVDFNGRST